MKRLAALLLILLSVAPVSAQSNCGNGLPCGPLPWAVPVMPNLASPTPMPTMAVTASSINPGAPTNTPAPISTPTPLLDSEGIQSRLNTINSLLNQTPVSIQSNLTLGLTDTTNLLSNGNFSAWTGSFPTDTPVGWGVPTPFGQHVNTYVTDAGNALRMVTSSEFIQINQVVMTNGITYTVSVDVISINSGGINIQNSDDSTILSITSPGSHTATFTANGAVFRITRAASPSDLVFTNVRLVTADNVVTNLSTSTGTFFGYLRGLDAATFGPLAPLVTLAVTAFILIVSVKTFTFLLPVLAAIFGVLRKIVVTILEFLPL